MNTSGVAAAEPVLNQKALAFELGISVAEMSGVFSRCKNIGLLNPDLSVQQQKLLQLLAHGLRYFLPAHSGKDSLGLPTAWGNPTLAKILKGPRSRIPVWSADTGEVHGPATSIILKQSQS